MEEADLLRGSYLGEGTVSKKIFFSQNPVSFYLSENRKTPAKSGNKVIFSGSLKKDTASSGTLKGGRL